MCAVAGQCPCQGESIAGLLTDVYNRGLVLFSTGHVCIPHPRTDREVVHFVPLRDTDDGRRDIGKSVVYGGGIELFKV